jgi:putative ABC transport system substrate-binding protein
VNYKSSVPLATQSLIDKGIDAIVQIEDNMTSAVFSSITEVARENGIPVFSFVNEQAKHGSVIVYAPDYVEGARRAGSFAARIMRGEEPVTIPLEQIERFSTIVNMRAAREAGLTIPQDIIDAADVVLDDQVE